MSQEARREMGIYAKAGCIAEEAIGGIRTVAAFNAQEHEVKKYQQVLKQGVKSGLRKGAYSGCLSASLLLIIFVFMGSCLLYGSYLYKIGILDTPGDIFVVLMAIMSGAYHLGQASPHLMVMLNARIAASTVYQTIDRTPSIDAYSTEGRKIYTMEGKIVFKKVNFSYPTRPDVKVLRSFSLTVHPGQTIALVGHSGSGKSTCIGILNRLYEFQSGHVSIDGHDIRDLNLKWLRSVIGTVEQHPVIFNDTVENNLKVGNDLLSEKDMVNACRMANVHGLIDSLPNVSGGIVLVKLFSRGIKHELVKEGYNSQVAKNRESR
uniref:ABC transmembrane type-1 domain-containing protein n=1 Tax=Steinernema glaseri TaxID=37863 RepID=A0A1I8AT29_9BILA